MAQKVLCVCERDRDTDTGGGVEDKEEEKKIERRESMIANEDFKT